MERIEAEKSNLQRFFKDFWFSIPEYQRPYVWKEDNVSELLEDLWESFITNKNKEYFVGSIVLKKISENGIENEYEVLDGQQRLTTFALIFNVLKNMFSEDTQLVQALSECLYQEGNKYTKTPERQRIVFKIRGKSNEFFTNFIKENRMDINEKEDISVKNIKNAISTIEEFFEEKRKEGEERVKEFIAYLLNEVVLIYVSTNSLEDAFRLFTILNNRGVPLTSADILKAINIGEIEKSKDKVYDWTRKWEEMQDYFGDDFERFLEHIRVILIKDKADGTLLKEFEEKIYKEGLLLKGEKTLYEISKYFNIYAKTIDFQIEEELPIDYKNLIIIMKEGMPFTYWIPPILQFYSKFDKGHLFHFLKKLEFKVMASWVIGETPGKRRETIYRILKKIDSAKSVEEILQDGDIFSVKITDLEDTLKKDLYGEEFTKYILLRYEYQKQDNSTLISEYKNLSIEHVLPQNPGANSEWRKIFTNQEIEEYKNKLGNLVLLNRKKNSSLSNLDFKEKKERYFKGNISIFPSVNYIMKKETWTKEDIKERTNEMISLLTKEV